MKNSKYLLLAVIGFWMTGLVLIPVGCDDNLDLKPGGATEEQMYGNEMDFHKGMYGVYAKMTDIYNFSNNDPEHELWLMPGDDISTLGSTAFETFNGVSPNSSKLNRFWERSYQLINRANTVLQKLALEQGDVIITPGMKGQITGEALFLRSWAYFNIWNFFGSNAPLVTYRIQAISDVNQPSSTGTAILDTVIANLQTAAELLPDEWPGNQLGRVTRDAAYGLLGKALVFRGDYTDNARQDYEGAIEAFENITSHSLVTHFGDNFNCQTENNSESLFEFQASISPGMDNIWLWNDFDIGGASTLTAYWGFFHPGGFKYDLPEGGSYEGFMWSDWVCPSNKAIGPSMKLVAAFDTLDPRMLETFQPYTSWDAGRYNGYIFAKYAMRGAASADWTTGNANNPRILRLADCILLHAEAIVKSGGSLTSAVDLINQIRTRARNSGPTAPSPEPADIDPAGLNANAVLALIRNERMLELAGEDNHRWLDLKRWHMNGDIDLSAWTADDNGFSSPLADFDFAGFYTDTQGTLHYPIPTSEIETNPNVNQNPGY